MTHITKLKSRIYSFLLSGTQKQSLCDRRWESNSESSDVHLWAFLRRWRKIGEVSNKKLRKREMRRQKYNKFIGLLRSPSHSLVIAAQHLTTKYGCVLLLDMVTFPIILTLFWNFSNYFDTFLFSHFQQKCAGHLMEPRLLKQQLSR